MLAVFEPRGAIDRMTRPRATGALIIVLLLWCSSCTSDAAERQARPATVALGTWVGGLCAALERFGQETRIGAADDASLPTPNASHAETVSALQHLTTTVEALGVPAVEDGRAL